MINLVSKTNGGVVWLNAWEPLLDFSPILRVAQKTINKYSRQLILHFLFSFFYLALHDSFFSFFFLFFWRGASSFQNVKSTSFVAIEWKPRNSVATPPLPPPPPSRSPLPLSLSLSPFPPFLPASLRYQGCLWLTKRYSWLSEGHPSSNESCVVGRRRIKILTREFSKLLSSLARRGREKGGRNESNSFLKICAQPLRNTYVAQRSAARVAMTSL